MKMMFYNIFRLLRPRQWIRNFAVFAAIAFDGHLFDLSLFTKVVFAFVVFCILSSAVYIVNDLVDLEKDRMHPFKRFRPLAHKDIPLPIALILAIFLILISFFIGFLVNPAFFLLLVIYLILQLLYSFVLKQIEIIDILAIAAGYILRVYGGEFASGYHISVWLLVTTIAISLFLAVGKRRSELTLVSRYSDKQIALLRKTLSHYSEQLLDVYLSIFATATFISYSLFTFFEQPAGTKIGVDIFLPNFLPDYFQRKWLMITILPVVYGLMRYLQDIYEKHEGESTEKVLLSDRPLLFSVTFWVFLVIVIIYFLPS